MRLLVYASLALLSVLFAVPTQAQDSTIKLCIGNEASANSGQATLILTRGIAQLKPQLIPGAFGLSAVLRCIEDSKTGEITVSASGPAVLASRQLAAESGKMVALASMLGAPKIYLLRRPATFAKDAAGAQQIRAAFFRNQLGMITAGISSGGTGVSDILANSLELLGIPVNKPGDNGVKKISGYKTARETLLALMRGEVELYISSVLNVEQALSKDDVERMKSDTHPDYVVLAHDAVTPLADPKEYAGAKALYEYAPDARVAAQIKTACLFGSLMPMFITTTRTPESTRNEIARSFESAQSIHGEIRRQLDITFVGQAQSATFLELLLASAHDPALAQILKH